MPSTELALRPDASAIEQVLMTGDLSRLTSEQRVSYYNSVCQSLGLNPLTKPFAYLKLNGKEILYALRDAAEQLRKLHGVSIVSIDTAHVGDVYVVTVKAQDKTGRTDASTGAVTIASLKGENLANALMKAETKAKRRVTLSICGLGMLDETEVETVQPQGYTVTAPASRHVTPRASTDTIPSVPNGGDSGNPLATAYAEGLQLGADIAADANEQLHEDDGRLYIERIDRNKTKNANVTRFVVVLSDGREVSTINTRLGDLAEQLCQDGDPVQVETKSTKWGEDLTALHRDEDASMAKVADALDYHHSAPLTEDDIPFLWLVPFILPALGLLLA